MRHAYPRRDSATLSEAWPTGISVAAPPAVLSRRGEREPDARRSRNGETPMLDHIERARSLAERIPYGLIALVARVAVAGVFWRSGQTKVDGFAIAEKTFDLFREEYKVPLLPPDLAAYFATAAEHVFPVLLVIGFASRLSALGLIGMTLVIQLFVYPDAWSEHILWIAPLLLILGRGPGALSLDHLVWQRNARQSVMAH
jgi:putative oxidoreductase